MIKTKCNKVMHNAKPYRADILPGRRNLNKATRCNKVIHIAKGLIEQTVCSGEEI